jgi:hypothetical protein
LIIILYFCASNNAAIRNDANMETKLKKEIENLNQYNTELKNELRNKDHAIKNNERLENKIEELNFRFEEIKEKYFQTVSNKQNEISILNIRILELLNQNQILAKKNDDLQFYVKNFHSMKNELTKYETSDHVKSK